MPLPGVLIVESGGADKEPPLLFPAHFHLPRSSHASKRLPNSVTELSRQFKFYGLSSP